MNHGQRRSGYLNPPSGSAVNARWDNLVAGWHLDEESDGSGAVARADVLGNYELTDNYTVASTDSGKISRAADLVAGNTEYFTVDANGVLMTGATGTFSGWVRNEAGTTTEIMWSANSKFAIQKEVANTLTVYATPANYNRYHTAAIVPVNTWVHLVIVYNGAEAVHSDRFKLYADGVLTAESDSVGTIPTTLDNGGIWNIGRYSGGGYHWDGQFDEWYVFSDVKDQAWATDMHNSGAGRSYPD